VDQHLRDQFDRAVGDDPGARLDEMATAAITAGTRLRQRRHYWVPAGVAAGVVVVIGVVAGLTLPPNTPKPEEPPMTVAAALMPRTAPTCVERAVETDITDAVIFLTPEVTEVQRSALDAAISLEPNVESRSYESREDAYRRFAHNRKDNPDLIKPLSPARFPDSFRLRFRGTEQYSALRARYATMAGVQDIIGRKCAAGAPTGGLL
jgi:cell division transport system permease protein